MNKFIRVYESKVNLMDCSVEEFKDLLVSEVNDLIVDYLSFSKESYPVNYYFKDIKFLDQSLDCPIKFDSEVKEVDREKLIRNFRILAYIGEPQDIEDIYFPKQETSIQVKSGQILIYPTSFMFPYKRNLNKEMKVLELNYYFRKEIIIDPIKNGLGSHAVY